MTFLRHPWLLVFGLQLGDQIFVALRTPIGDDRHDALDDVGADALQHVGFSMVMLKEDRWNLALTEPELVDFFQAELGVGYGVRHEQQEVGRADLTFWISEVASESGGVQTSSTTS